MPHSRTPPQPSDTGPQFAPAIAQVRRTHTVEASKVTVEAPQTLGRPPPPQLSPVAQLPHSRRPPQPSDTGPQFAPAIAQVRGVQPDVPPQRLGIPPPPQVCGAVQDPQLMIPPQPSPMGPQVAPADSQVTRPQPRRASSLPVSYVVMMSGDLSTVASIPITPG